MEFTSYGLRNVLYRFVATYAPRGRRARVAYVHTRAPHLV
jgi:hypothetical protein